MSGEATRAAIRDDVVLAAMLKLELQRRDATLSPRPSVAFTVHSIYHATTPTLRRTAITGRLRSLHQRGLVVAEKCGQLTWWSLTAEGRHNAERREATP